MYYYSWNNNLLIFNDKKVILKDLKESFIGLKNTLLGTDRNEFKNLQ